MNFELHFVRNVWTLYDQNQSVKNQSQDADATVSMNQALTDAKWFAKNSITCISKRVANLKWHVNPFNPFLLNDSIMYIIYISLMVIFLLDASAPL